ncbi:MAG: cell surface protein [Myxococcaceae bacterium]|nr:cell surface protein [Myxococcaceae bacterium]
MSRLHATLLTAVVMLGCGPLPSRVDGGDEPPVITGDGGSPSDAGGPDAGNTPDAGPSPVDAGAPRPVDPWADRVSRVRPGEGSGFGQDRFPEVVLGPPSGGGLSSGSLDVLSLGRDGVIELEFTDLIAVDGPGVDLLVFENPFGAFFETGVVAVSDDGIDWKEFPCDAQNADAGFPGCAGAKHVFANPAMGISGTDPLVAGGDGFDLAAVGLSRARFVRVRDSGANRFYASPGGGFDLDALAVVNGRLVDGGVP